MFRRGAGKERWTHVTHGPRSTRHSPCFVCAAAFTSIKCRGRRYTPLCVTRHCDDTCIDAARRTCTPTDETCSYQLLRHPCSHPTFRPEPMHVEARVRQPSGIRHEDEPVCSPDHHACDGRALIAQLARDPAHWSLKKRGRK
jgi:hypothetical protein